jgi:peptidoglycan/LPS O-acetylase OafA/YrhL
LARLGRWSLSYYMLHQPVMIGFLMVLGWVGRKCSLSIANTYF